MRFLSNSFQSHSQLHLRSYKWELKNPNLKNVTIAVTFVVKNALTDTVTLLPKIVLVSKYPLFG